MKQCTRFVVPFLAAISVIFLGTACTTTRGYEGPARSTAEVAHVKGYGVRFLQVNGIAVGVNSEELEVAAGKNLVTLSINASNYAATEIGEPVYKLEFNAEGGKSYAVTGTREGAQLCAYLIGEHGQPDFGKSAGCITR